MSVKRTISLIAAICFVLTGLFSVPSFADSSDQITSVGADTSSGTEATSTSLNNAVEPINPATYTSGTAINATGAAAGATGAAFDATGAAIAVSGAALSITGSALSTSKAAITTAGAILSTSPGAIASPKDDESLWYIPQISMKKEHQKLLWDYCKKRKIDYIDMLALISLESNFDEKCSSGKCKGYFQISTSHHKNLAATLKTANKPLDGAININWGTAMYSWILADERLDGLQGKKLRDAALSIYQRGTGGYDKNGISKSYLAKYYKKRDIIVAFVEENKENAKEDLKDNEKDNSKDSSKDSSKDNSKDNSKDSEKEDPADE